MARLADVIRWFVEEQYVIPARANKTAQFTVRAGDVHAAMRLSSRMPAVCSVLESARFLRKNGLKLVERRGPRQGANVYFTYEPVPNDATAADARVKFTSPLVLCSSNLPVLLVLQKTLRRRSDAT
jgi:hypothetical protein